MQRASVRFRALSNSDNPEVMVGGRQEKVIAFEFRNEGTDTNLIVQKDGAGFTLAPGEEKAFAVDGHIFFEDAFLVKWNDTGASPVRRGVLTEMYVKP